MHWAPIAEYRQKKQNKSNDRTKYRKQNIGLSIWIDTFPYDYSSEKSEQNSRNSLPESCLIPTWAVHLVDNTDDQIAGQKYYSAMTHIFIQIFDNKKES